jgi:hypothetical protein
MSPRHQVHALTGVSQHLRSNRGQTLLNIGQEASRDLNNDNHMSPHHQVHALIEFTKYQRSTQRSLEQQRSLDSRGRLRSLEYSGQQRSLEKAT